MSVSIRPAEPGDLGAICSLIPSPEELFLVYPKGRYPLTTDQLERLLKKRMEPTVLLAGGKVAGFADFYGYKERESVYIGNVVVDPAQRGKGFGKSLMLYMIRLAFAEYGLPRVRISVYNRNTAALMLYLGLGFRPYAARRESDMRGDPVVLIHLRLRSEDFPPSLAAERSP